MIRNPATGRPFEWEFRRGEEVIPFAASSRLMVNDTGSLLGACLGAAGIAQLLEIYARDLIAQNRLVHLLPEWRDAADLARGTLTAVGPPAALLPQPYVMIARPAARHRPGVEPIWRHLKTQVQASKPAGNR